MQFLILKTLIIVHPHIVRVRSRRRCRLLKWFFLGGIDCSLRTLYTCLTRNSYPSIFNPLVYYSYLLDAHCKYCSPASNWLILAIRHSSSRQTHALSAAFDKFGQVRFWYDDIQVSELSLLCCSARPAMSRTAFESQRNEGSFQGVMKRVIWDQVIMLFWR